MAEPFTTLTSILTLLGTASFMILITLFIGNYKPFKSVATKGISAAKVAFGVLLGLLAILATLMGTATADGTILNVRELVVMIAGVGGGPIGGIIAGVMSGLHRFTLGGASALPCTVSTIMVGVVAGFVSVKMAGKHVLLKAGLLAFVLELAAAGWALLLLPPNQSLPALQKATVPTIIADTIGLVLWVYMTNKLKQPNSSQ